MFDAQTLRQLWPDGDSSVPRLIEGISEAAPAVFPKYGLDSNLTIAHAMAQFSHETDGGRVMVENIHYTARRACQVWPTRFSSVTEVYKKIGSYPGDPLFSIKLMNEVYGGRMGNRPGTSDGSHFIGHGLSQITGRDSYERVGAMVRLDLVSNPELSILPENALECGVADFVLCGCLPYAERDDIIHVTRKLNGGYIGMKSRKEWLRKWKHTLNV